MEQKIVESCRRMMVLLLTTELRLRDYSTLHQMCERLKITNEELIKISHTDRGIDYSLTETIYTDMICAIYKKSDPKIDRNLFVFKAFYEIVSKKYTKMSQKIEKYEEAAFGGEREKAERRWDDIMRSFGKLADNDKTVAPFMATLFILCCPIREFSDIHRDLVSNAIENSYDEFELHSNHYLKDNDFLNEDDFYFYSEAAEKESLIFESDLYKKYIVTKLKEMIEYYNKTYMFNFEPTAYGLPKFMSSLQHHLKNHASDETQGYDMSPNGIPRFSLRNIMSKHHLSPKWLMQATGKARKNFSFAMDFEPNASKILTDYYTEYIKQDYRYQKYFGGEPFTEEYFYEKFILQSNPTPEEAYINLVHNYQTETLVFLVTKLKDEYYRNFSWERLTKKTISQRYEDIISSLENELEREKKAHTEQVQVLKNKIDVLTEKDALDELSVRYAQITETLNKKINDKDNEILELKNHLASKDAYINALLTLDDNDDLEEHGDISSLQSKRYLFVGYANEALPELKKTFPNSIFMDSENTSLMNLKVDAIVMLIKYMSHSMYYKVMSSGLATEVPIVRCNTKNINTIYTCMLDLLI